MPKIPTIAVALLPLLGACLPAGAQTGGAQTAGAQTGAPPAAQAGVQSPAPAPSRAQQLMGDVNPKLAELTDQVLFGDVWERPGLSRRDRSLVTVASLITQGRPDQLRSHMALALRNGVTPQELTETVTQMAFYAGWPAAASAIPILREVLKGR